MKIYLAGPMRGKPHFNFPAFAKATAKLRKAGHTVFSPAEHDVKVYGKNFAKGNTDGDEKKVILKFGFSLRRAFKSDLDWICDNADAVALLPGWEKSKGATAERQVAIAINVEVIEL